MLSEEKSLRTCCPSSGRQQAGICHGATGPSVDVKYTVWLVAVKDLCQLLICASRVFDLLSAYVELLGFSTFAADLQANVHSTYA